MSKWVCKCDCGNIRSVYLTHLRGGKTVSCGCHSAEACGNRMRTHGMSSTATYRVWRGLLSRCRNPSVKGYKDYGGRGIKVCDRWLSFESFLQDMGKRPAGKSIDRIDPNGDYEPNNCRWATADEQQSNKRSNVFVEIDGVVRTQSQWQRILGVPYSTLSLRISKGMSPKDALLSGDLRSDPNKGRKRSIRFNGV